MKSRVFSVTSVEQIEPRLQDIRQEGLAPTLAIVFSSVTHDLNELRTVFTKYDIEVFGASSSGEITNDEIHEESIVVMLLDEKPPIKWGKAPRSGPKLCMTILRLW
jgi:hypothetical protein